MSAVLLTRKQKEDLLKIYNRYGMLKALEYFVNISPAHKQYVREKIAKYPKFGIRELQDLVEDIMERPLAFKHPLEGLVHTFRRVPEIYAHEIAEARKGMKGRADTGLPKAMERVLSLLRYVSAPITAVTKAFIDEPVEQALKLTGVRHDIAKTIGEVAGAVVPIVGEAAAIKAVSKLPGITKKITIAGKEFEHIPIERRELFREYEKMTKLTREIEDIAGDLKNAGLEINTIIQKIVAMQKLNKEQRDLIKRQKIKRLARFEDALKEVTKQEGFTLEDLRSTFVTLAGSYESIRKSHPLLEQVLFSMDEVYKISKYLTDDTLPIKTGDKISATKALIKSLSGELPYKSELEALTKIFGKKFGDFIEKYAELLSENEEVRGFSKFLLEAVNLPRTIMASVDMSAFLRQGIVFIGRKEFWKNVKPYFKAMFTKDGYRSVLNSISSDLLFPHALKYKLQFTDVERLTGKEEMFMSSIATRIPGLGKMIEKSEEGYTAFLNKLRFDIFRNAYLRFESKLNRGLITHSEFDQIMHQLTRFINNATGRGETLFGVPLRNELAYFASNIFFAPRLIAGRINTIFDVIKATTGAGGMHPLVRREVLRDTLRSASIIGSLLGLAYLAGADINLNPTSSDFLKIRIKNTRIDIFGGFQQYIVLISRLASEAYTISSTDITRELNLVWGSPTSLDIIVRFAAMKTSPFLSFMIDLITGKDFTGKNLDLGIAIAQRFVPMIVLDIINMVDHGMSPIETLGITALVFFGAGIAVYGVNDHYNEYFKDKNIKREVDRKMALAGIHLPFVHSFMTYKGAKLTDQQAHEFLSTYAKVVYPILYEYLKDKTEHEMLQTKVKEEVNKIKTKVKEYVGNELFGIPRGLVINLTRQTSQLLYNELLSKNIDISPRELRKRIEKETEKIVDEIVQDMILTHQELKKWVKQNQR